MTVWCSYFVSTRASQLRNYYKYYLFKHMAYYCVRQTFCVVDTNKYGRNSVAGYPICSGHISFIMLKLFKLFISTGCWHKIMSSKLIISFWYELWLFSWKNVKFHSVNNSVCGSKHSSVCSGRLFALDIRRMYINEISKQANYLRKFDKYPQNRVIVVIEAIYLIYDSIYTS
ncbi:uncharacterized protein EV154DRAFT_557120 [Mucor mucedo]|uniref:uncharacterized protein n=1 Tax=Mucor mucedo TaxID=29922 RepID=UPI00221F9E61|nr:uncharacterized protein EV154DRAFT_557120 [Mucor mucedo]KAI7866491.1 hypothetical protein EV154DRAFT_557120 [Mucor mucedo]